jgi:hypothetical protein
VQVEPMKSKLKAPGTKRLKLKYDILLLSFAYNFNLCRYIKFHNRPLLDVVAYELQHGLALKP